ncbi:T9SS type A sorting domain-containing protein [Algibacter sp. L4_22]|uniref:DUF7619 domain-containing protein n=1 Tax=Algibacter sp. L4_22 TaxID=2942477 RepID=UPI00201B882C|nr:T9SS type A sorting domain-containing protein [Algibacter sp. L4_22]MCL5127785.1 T9SS type A sorting domain-containing protein [Algibacter sp. L4_22]
MKHLYFFVFLVPFFINAQTISIPDAVFKTKLLSHNPVIDTNGDNQIQITEAESFTGTLDLTNLSAAANASMQIQDLTGIEFFINISVLRCRNNSISIFDCSALANLTYLTISNNRLTSLDVSNNLKLETLECNSNNLLTSLDVTKNTVLKTLRTNASPVGNLDLSKNTALESLYCYGSSINALNLENNSALINLRCNSNTITSLNLNNNPNLDYLDFSDNTIETIDLSANTNLRILDIDANLLSDLNLSTNIKLETIYCSELPLTSLDLSSNKKLQLLFIQNNPLLAYVNLRNGNNVNIKALPYNSLGERYMFISSNPNLEFICVDDVTYASENLYHNVDNTASFTSNCASGGSNLNTIKGELKYDISNSDCTTDGIYAKNKLITVVGTNGIYGTFTDGLGDFEIQVPTDGTFNVGLTSTLPSYFETPVNQEVNFTDFENIAITNFCIANTTVNDVNIALVPISDARPGFEASYFLVFENVGGGTQNGVITYNYPNELITFASASETPLSAMNGTLIWEYSNLQPLEIRAIEVFFTIAQPPTVNIDDILSFSGSITPIIDDYTVSDNSFHFNQLVIGSYDPNDITVFEGASITPDAVENYLNYRIRFQNSGTASAINVYVDNVLDANLDWNTLQITGASHSLEVDVLNANTINFKFENINLPDENTDTAGSMGYVTYRIKPKATTPVGATILNQADIIFDYNEPIITNMVETHVVETLSTNANLEPEKSILVYPNPVNNQLHIHDIEGRIIKKVVLYTLVGSQVLETSAYNSSLLLNIANIASGLYLIKIVSDDGTVALKKLAKK